MTTHTCDKCEAKLDSISRTYKIGLFFGGDNATLCLNCFEPYLKLLKQDKIVPKGLLVKMNY